MRHFLSAGAIALMFLNSATADFTNRQIIPLGERESFLANAGTGDAADTGAVYYNPAGLTAIKADKISVLGSVYLSYSTQTDALAHLDGTDLPYTAKGFNTIPVTFVVTKRLEDWTLAFSVLIPESLQAENRVSFTTPNTAGVITQSYRFTDTWLGLSAAHALDPNWSVGATLFVIQHSEVSMASIVADFPNVTGAPFVMSSNRSQFGTLGLSADLGVAYKPIPDVSLGLRFQTQAIQLSGSGDTYSATRTNVPGTPPTTEDLKNTPANYKLPFDMTFGTAFNLFSVAELLADVSWQFGTTYDSLPGSTLNSHYQTSFTPRVNLGLEVRPGPSLPLRVGFFYNPSAIHDFTSGNSLPRENFYGLTAGVALTTPHVETGGGIFYIWSRGQNVVSGGAATQLANYSSSGIGGLLTTAYVF